jgi:uncharacterized protein with PIN domain
VKECEHCKGKMEWTRYKDVPLHFDKTTRYVTVEAWLCPVCNRLEVETDA